MPDDLADQQKIIANEVLRQRVAALVRDAAKPATSSWLTDDRRWLITALLIPVVTAIFGLMQAYAADIRATADKEIEERKRSVEKQIADEKLSQDKLLADAREDVGAMTALAPLLGDREARKAEIALAIFAHLGSAQRNATAKAQFDAVRAAVTRQMHSTVPEIQQAARAQDEQLEMLTGGSARVSAGAAPVTPVAVAAIQEVVEQRPLRAYLQILDETQRSDAQAIQTMLQKAGVSVPGIENVNRKRTAGNAIQIRRSQIRFFNPADLAAAKWTQSKLPNPPQWQLVRADNANGSPPGQLEIWWSSPKPQ